MAQKYVIQQLRGYSTFIMQPLIKGYVHTPVINAQWHAKLGLPSFINPAQL